MPYQWSSEKFLNGNGDLEPRTLQFNFYVSAIASWLYPSFSLDACSQQRPNAMQLFFEPPTKKQHDDVSQRLQLFHGRQQAPFSRVVNTSQPLSQVKSVDIPLLLAAAPSARCSLGGVRALLCLFGGHIPCSTTLVLAHRRSSWAAAGGSTRRAVLPFQLAN